MELYHYGSNVEIVRSLNPQMVMLTTGFGSGKREIHRLWRELLEGGRGLVLWDDKLDFIGPDGTPGVRAERMASYFREFRGGLGALLINSRRHTDPDAILYSPSSLGIHSIRDRTKDGDACLD